MFSKELTDWVSGRVKQWLTSDNTVESMLKQLLSIDNGKDQLVIKSRTWLKERLKQYVQKHQDTAAKQLVPQEIQSAIVSYLPGLSKTMVSKAKVYVESAEGQEKKWLLWRRTFCRQKASLVEWFQCFFPAKK